MEIRDPIHGFIEIDDYLEPFLDLPVMIRARRLKQTAMTFWVYPGANHTRFEHLLGCMHVAKHVSIDSFPSSFVVVDGRFRCAGLRFCSTRV